MGLRQLALCCGMLLLVVACTGDATPTPRFRPEPTVTPLFVLGEAIAVVKQHVQQLPQPGRLSLLQSRLNAGFSISATASWDGFSNRWVVNLDGYKFHYYERTQTVDYVGSVSVRVPTATSRPTSTTPVPTRTPTPTRTPIPTQTPQVSEQQATEFLINALISCVRDAYSWRLSDAEKQSMTTIILDLPTGVEWVGGVPYSSGKYIVTGPGLRYDTSGDLTWTTGTWEFPDDWRGDTLLLGSKAKDPAARLLITFLQEKGAFCLG